MIEVCRTSSRKIRIAAAMSAPEFRLGLFALFTFLAYILFVAAVGTPSASAACPNAVFRSGPSAKLPDCRAYELVTPRYTAGLGPVAITSDGDHMFPTQLVDSQGDSVTFGTLGGALPGFPGTGLFDQYRSIRTENGWITERHGVFSGEAEKTIFGGATNGGEYSIEVPSGGIQSNLWAPWAGQDRGVFLRGPDGVEPLARGSLGDDPTSEGLRGKFITPHAEHVIFESKQKLEPEAPDQGTIAIYDRTPGGLTHVVSLLPGDVAPSVDMEYLTATPDGSEVAFTRGGCYGCNFTEEGNYPLFVRRNNAETVEVLRPSGVALGKKMTCVGEPSSGATLEYQWLRDAQIIPGATSATYTVVPADEGRVVQCMVTASSGGGTTISASPTRVVAPYVGKHLPEGSGGAGTSPSGDLYGFSNEASVGTQLTCGTSFTENPTMSYQWLRDGTEVPAATNSTYTPVESEVGKVLQCRVMAATADGKAVAYSGPRVVIPLVAKPSSDPTISNVTDPGSPPAAGDELSCTNGGWTDSPTFEYQWLRNGTPIGGAAASTYTVTVADESKLIQCAVLGTNPFGIAKVVSGRLIVDPQPSGTPPRLRFEGYTYGPPRVGQSLSCFGDEWEPSEYPWEPTYDPTFSVTHQWFRNGAPIAGATTGSYTLTNADLGTIVECGVIGSDSAGSVLVIHSSAQYGYVKYIRPAGPPIASANIKFVGPSPGYTFDGLYDGKVFWDDSRTNFAFDWQDNPGNLYTIDLDTEEVLPIATTGDAQFVNVSEDGSHAMFTSPSQLNGEGIAGQPNLYVWSREDGSVQYVATVKPFDIENYGGDGAPGLTNLGVGIASPRGSWGPASDHSRSTPDGTVFAFETTAQLTSFNNREASPKACHEPQLGKELCTEIYRYDTGNGQLLCISCGPGTGPATGEARFQTSSSSLGTLLNFSTVSQGLTDDGEELVFESLESLVSRDRNGAKDVYRWKKGAGLSLLSTGHDLGPSTVYAMTREGDDVIIGTHQALLPEDENGATVRLYDARVDGGFAPPESSVTEPCSNDVCQGAPSAAPEEPQLSSSSINGRGDASGKLKCGKGLRRRVRHGEEVCVPRKRHHRSQRKHDRMPHAGGGRRAAR